MQSGDKESVVRLESMLDSAIAAYEAHREALQRIAATLDTPPSSSSASPPSLSNMEKKKLVSDIHAVLETHPLRFSHFTPNYPQRSDFTATSMAQKGSESYPSGNDNRGAVSPYEKSNYISSPETRMSSRPYSYPVTPQPFSSSNSSTNAYLYTQGSRAAEYGNGPMQSSSSLWNPSSGSLSPFRNADQRNGRGGGLGYDTIRGLESEKKHYTVGNDRVGAVSGTSTPQRSDGRGGMEVSPPTTTPPHPNQSTNSTASLRGSPPTNHPPSFSAGLGSKNTLFTPSRPSEPHKVGVSLTAWPLPENTRDGSLASPSSPSAGVGRRSNTIPLAEQYNAYAKGISPSTRWEGVDSLSRSRSTGGGAGRNSSSKMEEENRFNTLRSRPQEISRSTVTSSFRDPNHTRVDAPTSPSPVYCPEVHRRSDPAVYDDPWAGSKKRAAAPMGTSTGVTREPDAREREEDSWRYALVGASTPEPLYYRTPLDHAGDGREVSPSYPLSIRVATPRRSPYRADMFEPSTSVLRESSPAAIRYMHKEDEELQQRKEASERLLHSMAPSVLEKTPGKEVETAILHQLQREQLLLENQLNRMQMEQEFLLQRNPKDNGSEPRYSQLNHRIGKVSADLKRIDREIQVVKGLETGEKIASMPRILNA